MKTILYRTCLTLIFMIMTLTLAGCEIDGYGIKAQIPEEHIKNVILFIGDGMGPEHVEAARLYQGYPLVMQSTEFHAMMTTSSLSSGYTDSAAAATALATGTKVLNNAVRMTEDGEVLESIIDILSDLSVKTGLITTDFLDEATPSGFLSYAETRLLKDDILLNMTETKADLIIAKAPKQFESSYMPGFVNAGFDVITKTSQLTTASDKLLVALSSIVATGSGATLDDLVCFALDYLDNSENGFFLTVEGANIDKQSHLHDLENMILELLAFDDAIEVAMRWAKDRKDTLILVTADHECGGLTIEAGATHENILEYAVFTTDDHTNANVDVFMFGTDVAVAQGIIDITDIFHLIHGIYALEEQ